MEVWFQGHQGDREYPLYGQGSDQHLATAGCAGVWLLRQRQSQRGSSEMDSGPRATHRRILQAAHADVQRLRAGGGAIFGNGPATVLLVSECQNLIAGGSSSRLYLSPA